MRTGGIILCGGRSTRMGKDKATLPFGSELMLQRVIRLLGKAVDLRSIVVVAAERQELPPLPSGVRLARDERTERGPLEGFAAGLNALSSDVEAAYITSCDVPLLVPEFVARMFELLADHDIAVPREGEQFHPLAAVYRTSVLPAVRQLLQADRLRPRFLFDERKTRIVDVAELRPIDPHLGTLVNLNYPGDYEAALLAAGLGRPPEQVERPSRG